MEFIKKNFAVLLAFILPIALIVIVALSTYLPSLFLKTDYNFIYATCSDSGHNSYYYCPGYLKQKYTVVNGKLVINEVDVTKLMDLYGRPYPYENQSYSSRIFLHDTKKNESKEITSEEAQALNLSSLVTSPDGVSLSSGYDNDTNFFFIFGNGRSYGYDLIKGKSRKKLNLI